MKKAFKIACLFSVLCTFGLMNAETRLANIGFGIGANTSFQKSITSLHSDVQVNGSTIYNSGYVLGGYFKYRNSNINKKDSIDSFKELHGFDLGLLFLGFGSDKPNFLGGDLIALQTGFAIGYDMVSNKGAPKDEKEKSNNLRAYFAVPILFLNGYKVGDALIYQRLRYDLRFGNIVLSDEKLYTNDINHLYGQNEAKEIFKNGAIEHGINLDFGINYKSVDLSLFLNGVFFAKPSVFSASYGLRLGVSL